MNLIQSQEKGNALQNSSLVYFSIFFILIGIIYIFNFIRPIFNLYTISFEINWAEFQILEIFDILSICFGALLIILGFSLFIYQKFNKFLLIFGGILFFIFNLLDPSHLLMVANLFSSILGAPPSWMQVIPQNLFVIYIASWSLLSISNVILQFVGFYVAIRIIINSNPQKSIIQYLYFYCWVIGLSGIILCLQSVLVLSLTMSWSSITVAPYLINVMIWSFMMIAGIAGLVFVRDWMKNQLSHLKAGQLSLVSYGVMYVLISFSDFAMKSVPSLVLSVFFAVLLIIYAFKIPSFLRHQNN